MAVINTRYYPKRYYNLCYDEIENILLQDEKKMLIDAWDKCAPVWAYICSNIKNDIICMNIQRIIDTLLHLKEQAHINKMLYVEHYINNTIVRAQHFLLSEPHENILYN